MSSSNMWKASVTRFIRTRKDMWKERVKTSYASKYDRQRADLQAANSC